ncbi:zinc finger protein 135-like [Eurosta solidaginis]|uniref:zinc finger protein 135-like n=1 Tax=Eurosta solidaginis TaxID=178769 RepID=UPI003530A5B7
MPQTITDHNQNSNEPLAAVTVQNCKQNAGTAYEPTPLFDHTYAANIGFSKKSPAKCLSLQHSQSQLRDSTLVQNELQVYSNNDYHSDSTQKQHFSLTQGILKISYVEKYIDDSMITSDPSITCNQNNSVKLSTDDLSTTTDNGNDKTQMEHDADRRVFYGFECVLTECASNLEENYNNENDEDDDDYDDENQNVEIINKSIVDHITNKVANASNDYCRDNRYNETQMQSNVTAKSIATKKTITKSKPRLKEKRPERKPGKKVFLTSFSQNGKVDIIYTCSKCSLRFQHKSHFTIHMESKHSCRDLPTYTCAECWQLFEDEPSLQAHMNHEHPLLVLEFPCLLCERKCASELDLAKHKAEDHFEKRKFDCTDCGQRFISREVLNVHLTIHSLHSSQNADLKKHPWEEIKKQMQRKKYTKISNEEQLESSIIDILYTCPKCSLRYQHKTHFTTHMRNEHSCYGSPNYTCADCLQLFDDEDSLRTHITLDHPLTILEVPCLLCERKFPSESALSRHKIRYHFVERKNVCKECGENFTNKKLLRTHARIHYTRNRPTVKPPEAYHIISKNFACDQCDAAFADSTGLRMHKLLIHTKKLPT